MHGKSVDQYLQISFALYLYRGKWYHYTLCNDNIIVGMQLLPIRYVVFEYCDNLDLFNYLVTGPLEKQQRYTILRNNLVNLCLKTFGEVSDSPNLPI